MSEADQRQPETGGRRIEVQCLSCGRHGLLEGDERALATPLSQLTKRLRCSQCGSRAVKATAIRRPRDLARLMRARMGETR